MTERIVALDPGGTTGWAYWQDEPFQDVDVAPWDHFTCGQMGPDEHHERLYDWLGHLHTQGYTVVCESFEFRKFDGHRQGISLVSKEYIGVAKLFAKQRGVKYVEQSPGAAKPFVTDDKLKVMRLWVPGQQHARDALRHLIYYMVNRRNRFDLIESWQELI